MNVQDRSSSPTTRRTKNNQTAAGSSLGEQSPVLQHLRTKQEIVAQLLDGRLTLMQAAGRFQNVNRLLAGEGAGLHYAWQNADNGERVCRMLIGWVSLALADRPEKAELLTARLEQELQEHLAKLGSVTLS